MPPGQYRHVVVTVSLTVPFMSIRVMVLLFPLIQALAPPTQATPNKGLQVGMVAMTLTWSISFAIPVVERETSADGLGGVYICFSVAPLTKKNYSKLWCYGTLIYFGKTIVLWTKL